MAELKDSGARRDFGTGAVRDIAEGKGRCDLLPLHQVAELLDDGIIRAIGDYEENGNTSSLQKAIGLFSAAVFGSQYTAMLEAAKQYEDGCQKYGERNWQKGIPVHCYIDSGVRHYLKFRRGDVDEPHDRAFIWNMLGAIWTHENKPELIDLPFASKDKPETVNPVTDKPVENKPFDWEAFKTEKISVHCDTEDKAKAFVAECKRRFPSECRLWKNDEVNWSSYESETTYSIVGGEFLFADVESDRKDRYTIVDYPFNQKKDEKPHQFTDEEAQDLFGKENAEGRA